MKYQIFKKVIAVLITANVMLYSANCFAQGVAINTTGAPADQSAILDVSSTNSGILIPRMTKLQRNGIAQPAEGLMIYQTDDTTGFWYWDGGSWVQSIGNTGPTGPASTVIGPTGPTGPAGLDAPTGSTCCPTHYIGELYGGGVIYYIYTFANIEHGFIISLNEISSSAQWYETMTLVPGLNSWDGYTNTAKIVAQNPNPALAASLCANYNDGGYNDWHLPAIDEIKYLSNDTRFVLLKNLSQIPGFTFFTSSEYWSSTSTGVDAACTWYGNNASQGSKDKFHLLGVRCIRSF